MQAPARMRRLLKQTERVYVSDVTRCPSIESMSKHTLFANHSFIIIIITFCGHYLTLAGFPLEQPAN